MGEFSNYICRPLSHGPASQVPNRIIVHSMARQIDYNGERLYAATFLDRIGLSAHIMVAPDGAVIRCREDGQGAWHAKGHNIDSLGIEVLVPDVYDYGAFRERIDQPGWVSDIQLSATVDVVRAWIDKHKITRIERHSDVDPERKADPGEGFPWFEFLELVGWVFSGPARWEG